MKSPKKALISGLLSIFATLSPFQTVYSTTFNNGNSIVEKDGNYWKKQGNYWHKKDVDGWLIKSIKQDKTLLNKLEGLLKKGAELKKTHNNVKEKYIEYYREKLDHIQISDMKTDQKVKIDGRIKGKTEIQNYISALKTLNLSNGLIKRISSDYRIDAIELKAIQAFKFKLENTNKNTNYLFDEINYKSKNKLEKLIKENKLKEEDVIYLGVNSYLPKQTYSFIINIKKALEMIEDKTGRKIKAPGIYFDGEFRKKARTTYMRTLNMEEVKDEEINNYTQKLKIALEKGVSKKLKNTFVDLGHDHNSRLNTPLMFYTQNSMVTVTGNKYRIEILPNQDYDDKQVLFENKPIINTSQLLEMPRENENNNSNDSPTLRLIPQSELKPKKKERPTLRLVNETN